jgi:AcrR family transcriptional regulator
MAGGPTDLRERKKARTRAHIAHTAMTLFADRGFDEVTVAEVAETADVGVSTVFKYFPTKEDLFFDRQDEVVEHLSRVVLTRRPGESFAAACRRDTLELIEARDWRIGLVPTMGRFYRLVHRSPALRARARLLAEQAAADLAVTIAGELSRQPTDIIVATTANVLTALRNTLLYQAQQDSLAGAPVSVIAERLAHSTNQAFDLLAGELATMGRETVNGRDGESRRKPGA